MERQLRIQHFWVSCHFLLLCNKIKSPSTSSKVAIKGVAVGGRQAESDKTMLMYRAQHNMKTIHGIVRNNLVQDKEKRGGSSDHVSGKQRSSKGLLVCMSCDSRHLKNVPPSCTAVPRAGAHGLRMS